MIRHGGDNDGRRRGKHSGGAYRPTQAPTGGPARPAYINKRRATTRTKASGAAYRAAGETEGKTAIEIMKDNLQTWESENS